MKIVDNLELRQPDAFGSGHFGASRGSRKHIGIDIIALSGQMVYTPISGKITKQGWAYANDSYRYIEITGTEWKIRIFYAELDPAFDVGDYVPEDQFIGLAQDITRRYPGITPHIHFELYKASDVNRTNPIDPAEFLKKKCSK